MSVVISSINREGPKNRPAKKNSSVRSFSVSRRERVKEQKSKKVIDNKLFCLR